MKEKANVNRLFLLMTCIFSVFLLIVSSIACYYAYAEKKAQIFSSMDLTYSRMKQEYEAIAENFWQVYMPIFESGSSMYQIFKNYFTASETPAADLTPLEKRNLTGTLEQMRVRDNRIDWIALCSDNRTVNYIKYNDGSGVKELPESFPYLSDMASKTSQMEVYGARAIETPYGTVTTFAICGGVPVGMGSGKILIGYRLTTLENAETSPAYSIPSIRYYMLSGGQVVFDSFGNYESNCGFESDAFDDNGFYLPSGEEHGLISTAQGRLFVTSGYVGNNTSLIVSTASRRDILLAANRDTLWILSITLVFMGLSLFVHIGMSRSVSKEVAVIREGLNIIAEDHLDYRLPTKFRQGGLPEIAQNINEMSLKLNETIKKAYYFELKQKDAELAELQATFNPHFLYNTLEMLRSKCFSNGDEDTAGLIADLASIFRSLIGAKTFITLKEELAFSRKYLTLLSARYGDRVTIKYNIETSLLNYGSIRNVFQILIENYFVHGFDADRSGNFIHIAAKSLDGDTMLLSVEDNGLGMGENELAALNDKIEEPIRHGKESYGLKNLNQRLKLFYGPDYGMQIQSNSFGGLTVQMKLRKIRVEEYEQYKHRNMG